MGVSVKISIFGIGYVGSVSAACTAAQGHYVLAVDQDAGKVLTLNCGQAPVVEPKLDALIADQIAAGRLSATTDAAHAVRETDVSLVCVGTPGTEAGGVNLSQVVNVCVEIGAALRTKESWHTVVLRSTMIPGSMENSVIPALERSSGRRAGEDFGIAIFPEFLRESSAVDDFNNPSTVVVGCFDGETKSTIKDLCLSYDCSKHFVDIRTAEMIKYCSNAWHATKVSFANEIGWVCKNLNIDGQGVMDVMCSETRLNISSRYMKPGFAFGGSCLPKDLRALRHHARHHDIVTPLLDATLEANDRQIDRALKLVIRSGNKRVGMLGLAFKSGTDDLRESPLAILAEMLIGKGYDLKIYDRAVSLAARFNGNSRPIDLQMPHLSAVLVDDLENVIDFADTLVIGTEADEFKDLNGHVRPEHSVVDLIRTDPTLSDRCNYEGICW